MASKRIKILYVETYTHVAGGQKGLLDLVEFLNKDIFEPVVLIQGPGRLADELEKRGIRSIKRWLEPFKNRWLPFSWQIGVQPVLKVIREERPDVVHSNHLYAGRYSGRAAAKAGIPSLVTLRLVHEPEIYDQHNRWNTLKCHHRIVSNSDEGRKVFESDPEVRAKIITIKNGMDLSRFRPPEDKAQVKQTLGAQYGIDASSIILTQIASMVPQKGNEELLRVFLELAAQNPHLHLFLVGGDFAGTDNSKHLLKLAKDAGLGDRLHLTAFVRDVVGLLNMTDISLLCSRAREGLPRSIIEAMACGNPVIGTDVGGMRELIVDGENGYLVPPRDEPALRSRLQALIQDADARRRMGEKGWARAREQHDIKVMMARYEAIYRELAGQGA
jgi:glycosyltransferase involved in cell wall biosynthesis